MDTHFHRLAELCIAIGRSLDPEEMLQYCSFGSYLLLAVVYTVFVFFYDAIDLYSSYFQAAKYGRISGPPGSADTRRRLSGPFGRVLRIHSAFLLAALGLLRIVTMVLTFLPGWMTTTFDLGRNLNLSIVDIVALITVSLLAIIERRRLYSDESTFSNGFQ